ncbi:MAG TPA: V-type ATP synthase subunit K [Planctomycetes bacterium]|nr:V-type ATP synthase subunit K [Planctomycetota bacterium]
MTEFLGQFSGQLGFGLALGLAAAGSALGIGAAGSAAAGAWAREGREGKPLRFTYIILMGMPLSQTIYAFVFMLIGLRGIAAEPSALIANGGAVLGFSVACGLAQLFSAWMQGAIGAAGVRCLSESEGKGFAFLVISMGIAETVGLFGWVLLFLVLPVVTR